MFWTPAVEDLGQAILGTIVFAGTSKAEAMLFELEFKETLPTTENPNSAAPRSPAGGLRRYRERLGRAGVPAGMSSRPACLETLGTGSQSRRQTGDLAGQLRMGSYAFHEPASLLCFDFVQKI